MKWKKKPNTKRYRCGGFVIYYNRKGRYAWLARSGEVVGVFKGPRDYGTPFQRAKFAALILDRG